MNLTSIESNSLSLNQNDNDIITKQRFETLPNRTVGCN